MIAIVVVNSVWATTCTTLTSLQRSRSLIQILFLCNSAWVLTCCSWTFQLVLILWIVIFIIAFRRWLLLHALPPFLLIIFLNRNLFISGSTCDFSNWVCCRVPADIINSRWSFKWTWNVTHVVNWRRYAFSSPSDRLWLFLLSKLLSRVLERSDSFWNIIEVAQINGIAFRNCGLRSCGWLIFIHLRQFLLSLFSKISGYHSVTWALIFKVATVIVAAYMLGLTIEDVLWSIFHKFCPRGQRLLLVFIKHGSYFMKWLSLWSVIVVNWWSSITSPFNNLLSTLILSNFSFKYGV